MNEQKYIAKIKRFQCLLYYSCKLWFHQKLNHKTSRPGINKLPMLSELYIRYSNNSSFLFFPLNSRFLGAFEAA